MADNMIQKLRAKQMPSNLSPEEEEIRQRALEFRKSQGQENAPVEEGIIEGDLEDVVPYGSAISMATPLGGLRHGIRKAVEKGAESGFARKASRALWDKAVREPKILAKMAEDLPAAEMAVKAEQAAMRKASQYTKDVREGIKKPGLGAKGKPFEGDYVAEAQKISPPKEIPVAREMRVPTQQERIAIKRQAGDVDTSTPEGREQFNKLMELLQPVRTK